MGTPPPMGPAFRINSENGYSSSRSVATLKDGTFVVTWTDETEVDGQRFTTVLGQVFHANGAKLGQEVVVSSKEGIHRDVTVAALKDGGFVVSYSHTPDGSFASEDIWLRAYKVDRTAGNEMIATANTTGWQGRPVVTALDKGGFALSYNTTAGTTFPLAIQYFNTNGERVGSETVLAANGDLPSIATLRNGNTIVAFEDYGNEELQARIYRPDGSEVTPSGGIVLASTLSGYQLSPSVTALLDGRFVAAWTQSVPTSEDSSISSVRARIFTADGNPIGEDFQINVKTEGSQSLASVAALPNGGFAVAFEDVALGSGSDILTQSIRIVTFRPDGTRDSDEIVIATGGAYSVERPALSTLADGRLLITWTQLDQFNDPHSVARVLDTRTARLNWSGSSEGDNYVGTRFDDMLQGLGGEDRIYGSDGSDTILGGIGADSLDGGDGYDIASYATAAKRVDVSLAKKTGTAGEAAGDVLSSIEGLVGSAYNDILSGDGTANLLDGGRGADALQGGAGSDTYKVDSSGDVVVEAKGGGTDKVITVVSYRLGKNAEVEILTASSTYDRHNISLTGSDFANKVIGNAGANMISGLGGNDKIYGGLGNDVLTGGPGRDVFVFDTKPNTRTNKDRIVDFNVRDDSIRLDNAVFTKLGGAGSDASPAKLKKAFFTIGSKAKDKNDYLVYDSKKGVLLYDADGSGAGKAVEIASLPKNLNVTNTDFFVI